MAPTTTATTWWPRRSSGTPTTATSCTRGMPGEHVLDLERVHVLAAADDHVVEPPVEPEVAVLVEPADVAGVVPAVADRLLVGVGPVPVAGERLVGGHVAEDLAVLAEPQPRVQRGPSGAPGLRRLVAVDRVRVDLGRAVVVDEQPGRKGIDAALDQRARHRRPRVGERLDRREVEIAAPGVGDEVVEERGGEVERRDPLALDQLERGPGVPVRLADVAAADQVHRDERVDAHRVVQRHAAERPVAVAVVLVDDLREAARAVGAVRAGDALRPSGRAGGVEHQALVALVGIERAGVRGRRRAAAHRPRARARRRSPRGSSRGRPRTRAARAGRTSPRPTGMPSRGRRCRGGSGRRRRPAARAPGRRAARAARSSSSA